MKKIATHDSATGEKPMWLTWLLGPFAKTQSKTLKGQYDAGCRLFDIRVKKAFWKWRCAHGWWFTRRSVIDIFSEMNAWPESVSVTITYEGKTENAKELVSFVEMLKHYYPNIKYGPVSAKYGKDSNGIKVAYDTIVPADDEWVDAPSEQAFLPLDGKRWQTYIPIPWLWKQFYYKNVEFSEEEYKYVDFL